MIEERIDEIIDKYKKLIDTYANHVESQKKFLMKVLDDTLYIPMFKRLIKLKDKGYFKCADYDTKIQDILSNCAVIKQ